jgi:hypothetical protein
VKRRRRPSALAIFTTALAASPAVATCTDSTGPPPVERARDAGLTASLSGATTLTGAEAATVAVADAALRVLPALADTPVRPRLAKELAELAVVLAFSDWARVRRALDGAQALLDRYAQGAPSAEEADLAAIRLALDHVRTILPPQQ